MKIGPDVKDLRLGYGSFGDTLHGGNWRLVLHNDVQMISYLYSIEKVAELKQKLGSLC